MTTYCINDTECNTDEYCSTNNTCLKLPSFPIEGTIIFVVILILYIVLSAFFYKFSKNRKFNQKTVSIFILGGLLIVLGISSYVYYKKSITPYLAIVNNKCGATSYLKDGVCNQCPGGATFNKETNMCNTPSVMCGSTACLEGQVCAGVNGDMCCDKNLICGTTCCNKGQTCVDPTTGLCGECNSSTCSTGQCINGTCCPLNQIYTDASGNIQCCNANVCGNICCEPGQQCAQKSNGDVFCADLCGGQICGENQSCEYINGVQKACVNNNPQYNPPQYTPSETLDNSAICNYKDSNNEEIPLWCNPNGYSTNRTITYECAITNPTDSQCTQNDCYNTLNNLCGTYDVNYVNYNPADKSCSYTLTCDEDKLPGQCKSKSSPSNVLNACTNTSSANCPKGLTCCINNPTYNNKTNTFDGNYSGKFFAKNNNALYCYNDVPYQCAYFDILNNGICNSLITSFMGNIPPMSTVLNYSNTTNVVLVSLAGLFYTGKFMAMNTICPSSTLGLYGNAVSFTLSDISKCITKDDNSPSGFIVQAKKLQSDPNTFAAPFSPLLTQNSGLSGDTPQNYITVNKGGPAGKVSYNYDVIQNNSVDSNYSYSWYPNVNYIFEPQTTNNTFGIPVLSSCTTPTPGSASGGSGDSFALFYNGETQNVLTHMPGNDALIGVGNNTNNLSDSRYWFTLDKNGLLSNYWNCINPNGDNTVNIAVVNAFPDSTGFKGQFSYLCPGNFNTDSPMQSPSGYSRYNVKNNLTVQSNDIFNIKPTYLSQINSNIVYNFNVSPWIAIPVMS